MMERLGIKTNAGLMAYALRNDLAEHMGQKESPVAA